MILSQATQKVLAKAIQSATASNHEYCTVEHVFRVMLEEPTTIQALSDMGADLVTLKKLSGDMIANKMSTSAIPGQARPTIAIERMIQSAIFQVKSSAGANSNPSVQPTDLLVQITQLEDCHSRSWLEQQGIDSLKVKEYLSSSTSKNIQTTAPKKQADNQLVKDFLFNLNEKAKSGKVDTLIGRDHEVERVVQILCRRRKNNPILVGEPGVGKTAIAEGLALKITKGEVPKKLKDAVVFTLEIGSMMAGTKYRGEFEEKMKEMLTYLKSIPNAILFIDEIHTIIGAGATSGGSLDTANILKPVLTTGELKCIGSTTYKEYSNIFDKDAALSRRFQKVEVVEPSAQDTIVILEGLKTALEEHHGVKYTKDAIRAAVELSVKHIHGRFLPDKAIDILDEAGSMTHLKGETQVDQAVIEKTISKIARIPEKSVSTEEASKLKGLAGDLKSKIFGQDDAVDTIVSAIELSTSGLRNGEKPIGNFLFCGPTGVGKTELTKQLALELGVPFVRFDMSEYMEEHTVAKLIGAPPGYVGFEQNGLLTDAAMKNPHSVILLDEIEKAHPSVWNVLLQVMDHGTLTDSNGRKADFRHTVIILTSNVGAADAARPSIGLVARTAEDQKPTKAVEMAFSPEFRNRLDAIVYFNQLSRVNIMDVLKKNLAELDAQLKAKNVKIKYSDAAMNWLAEKGYDPKMGARPMGRTVQDNLKRPLAAQLLYGELVGGGQVKVDLKEGKIDFTYTKPTPKKPRAKKVTEAV